ncbi:hypothetical protein [Microbispora sp. H10949]|uniref:hypothetical protein n=1 Tax=Microbispora sp. H10949 TaxID=2729111 RepID=UPI0028738311|nr:hypothetical protein [Microbispora sp. H10949]
MSAVIGALAAIREPARFGALVMVGPSPRYIDDEGYVGGFSAADIEELLESLDSNYLGWSGAMAPVIMGNPGRPELGAELTNSFCRTDPEIARRFATVTFMSDNRADLSRVPVRAASRTTSRSSTSTRRADTCPPSPTGRSSGSTGRCWSSPGTTPAS